MEFVNLNIILLNIIAIWILIWVIWKKYYIDKKLKKLKILSLFHVLRLF
jgi:hypothetical protein